MKLAGIESGLGTNFKKIWFNFLRDEIELVLTHLDSKIYIYIRLWNQPVTGRNLMDSPLQTKYL
jgi:hypothetical protein